MGPKFLDVLRAQGATPEPAPVTTLSSRKLSTVSVVGLDVGWSTNGSGTLREELGAEKAWHQELQTDHHKLPIETLYARFGSDPVLGLGPAVRARNEAEFGRNVLTPPPKKSLLAQFGKTLVGGIQLLLWVGAFLCFVAYFVQLAEGGAPPDNLYMGFILGGLVLVLGLFTFWQEYSTNKVMESFTRMVPSYAKVVRGGQLHRVDATELVVGDVVQIESGDRIPADIRLIECQDLRVDNSSLTGESDPQCRSVECTHESPLETKNLAFCSSSALQGCGRGLVVGTGDRTFIGQVAGLASGVGKVDTPLSRELNRFVSILCGFGTVCGVTFFIVAQTMGYALIDSMLFVIGIIVANVPEGIIVSFTVLLALIAKRMAAKNCLVKNLHAVETLGACSVICSDKTGTLTQNKMSVAHAWVDDAVHSLADTQNNNNLPGLDSLSRVATLCSRATFAPDQEHLLPADRRVNGDASEAALLRCMEALNGDVAAFQAKHPKLFEIPFNSTSKFQVSVHDMRHTDDKRPLLVMKGAPERIVEHCKTVLVERRELELDAARLSGYESASTKLGSLGERVLGFCDARLPIDLFPVGCVFSTEKVEQCLAKADLRLVGLLSLIDPPRVGVAEAVSRCRGAGIRVVMVTGDHPVTAKAIATQIGIISAHSPEGAVAVVTGADLAEMGPEELEHCLTLHAEIVFARVSPQQKLLIVEAFQRLGQIVAVTGDGVNDSPALKKADIGIAMGIAGSDVSKQAADMILLDDNFASIVFGVEEGRLLFENLKKCISYLLTANIPELSAYLALIVLRIPLPLGTVPMLLVCLGTDIMPTISLSYEGPEGDLMTRPPRNPRTDRLLTDRLLSYSYGMVGLVEVGGAMFTYFVVMGQCGWWPSRLINLSDFWEDSAINDLEDSYGQEWTYYARQELEHTVWTAYFISMVVTQMANVLIQKCRRESLLTRLFSNPVVFLTLAVELGLVTFFSYTPGFSAAINLDPVKLIWWLCPLPFVALLILADEFLRLLLRRCRSWSWFQHEFGY